MDKVYYADDNYIVYIFWDTVFIEARIILFDYPKSNPHHFTNTFLPALSILSFSPFLIKYILKVGANKHFKFDSFYMSHVLLLLFFCKIKFKPGWND